MRYYLRIIYLLSVSVLFFQCSSVKRAGVTTNEKDTFPVVVDSVAVDTIGHKVSSPAEKDRVTVPHSAEIAEKTDTLKNIAPTDTSRQMVPSDNIRPTVLNDSTLLQDSLSSISPAVASDSIATDSTKMEKEILIAPVHYTSKDSTIFTDNNMGYLYGEAEITYANLGIKGEYITMDLDSNIISSTFGVDTLGKEFGLPVFTEGASQYEMKKVRYNFKTRKAFIHNIVTQEGEGNIVADVAKMNDDNSFYTQNAKYTTCDKHDHPDFYLNLSRAKVRPGKDVVTGPAWLVVADIPLIPIMLPFGFFPFTETYSSGVIMPGYGDEMNRGFYLQNGGYYFAINDYVDLALTGEIYTKGTWGVGARSNYRKRYKFSGNVNVYYLNTVMGEKELKKVVPEAYSESKDLRISWTHSQDPKANMYRTLSASVNFSTSQQNHKNLADLYSPRASQNTKSSSVNLTQRFPDSPWNLSATMNINQVSRDSTISATLPNISISMNRIYPFKRKKRVGNEKWYEKISMSYSGEFRNSITTKENKILKSNLIRDWTNGMKHSIPVSATFSLFEFIQISPAFNYTERWYTGAHKQAWDPIAKRNVVVDTIMGFKRVYDYSTSLSAQTKLYGMYVPWKIFGDKIQAIRHVFTPSISLSYKPDFSDPRYHFYEYYTYKNEYGEDVEYKYSPYSSMMFGTASAGKSGSISFDFKNNLEMKLRTEKDSTGIKKVSLIDDLGINFSYNMMADSMKWSMINSNIRLKLTKSYTLSLNATWDPYLYTLDHNGNPQKIDKLRIMNGKGFGKLYSTGTSFSYSFNQETFKKLFQRDKKEKKGEKEGGTEEGDNKPSLPDDGTIGRNPYESGAGKGETTGSDEFDADGYLKNEVQWNLSFNYSLRYGYGVFDKERLEYKGKLTHSFGLNGSFQPTKNWNFTFNTDFNFDLKRFTSLNCSVTRNLHCWSMTGSFIPIGPYKSYNFTIRANASLLQDLKYEQRSSPYDKGKDWY